MAVPSQDQSFQLFSCKWAWCCSTFSNNAGLVHHVVHDHVRRAIPVRRRDISMIRRAEEGKGESLKFSELMVDIYSYSSRESISHKPVQEPSSSLPSPPASSSPALHSPHHLEHSPGPAPSPSPPSLEHRKKLILIKSRSPDDISRQTSPPRQGQNSPANQITTFASLSSPAHERTPFSFEMPDSPSFSSLVQRPSKRKMTSNTPDCMSRHKIHLDRTYSLPTSHSSSSSSDSQNSVEAQLTQTEDDHDIDHDEDLDIRCHASNGLSSQAPDIPIPYFGMTPEHDELQWEPSQPAEEHLMDDPFQSQSNVHHHLENLPVTSQPPSQLQLDSQFPFHFHDRPRGTPSRALHTILTESDPRTAVPLSPPSPTSSPTFAVSTPVRQNWYQPPLKRSKRSTCNDKSADPSPFKADESVSQTKSKKMFRSGTLQITPASSSKEPKPMDIDFDANRQNNLATPQSPYHLDIFSQSSQDSSDLSQINSYPILQTQAPYQSQSLTQF